MSGQINEIEFDNSNGDSVPHSITFDYFDGNFDTDYWHRNDFELMQFTGLQDKNGVDIYESDVLKQTYEDGDVFGVVKYVMAEGGYITEGIDEIKDYPLCFNAYYSGKSEIVGNIHSNPELLEQ